MPDHLLLLARRGANSAKADYDAGVADRLTRERDKQSTSVILTRFIPETGKYQGRTIEGDIVQGDFYGINAPILRRRYGYSKQQGSDFGFFTDV